MKRQKLLSTVFIGVTSLLVTTILLSITLSLALYKKYIQGNGTYGEVSLRSYYERGSGTRTDPFVITRPRHLYNFSRLQGLGVYGDKPYYFQLGLEDLGGVDSNGAFMCYADDSSSTQTRYLDMSSSNRSNNPINAIGSEALPFYGVFDGKNVEIRNLNVYADPQDAGLFGYTAHGSEVKNLFLNNVTIHALGYTNDYADLYSPSSTIGNGVAFTYDPDPNLDSAADDITFDSNNQNTEFTYFYADENFAYTSQGSSPIPSVTITGTSNTYIFSSLLSGDLIKIENDAIVPDLARVFEFFATEKVKEGMKFPVQASSSASLIASSIDNYGQKHSRVLLTLEYNFTLNTAASNFIEMGVHISGEHGNNIGLIIGHCDGSALDCYVYNGSFDMNMGGTGYNNLEMGSNLGLIGKVGGTVENVLATESDVGVKDGKNIGVLDFTTIYKDVIDSNSFSNSLDSMGGKTYVPIPTTKYEEYLRQNTNNQYITLQEDSISFRGRTIVTNTDLGVFTVATDAATTGDGNDSGSRLNNSVILTEDLAINNNYYIYYSTGEFNKSYQVAHGLSTFDKYVSSYNSYNSNSDTSHILPGYHLPSREQITRDSFETREARQNYFLRFKLEPSYRQGKGFYFSDLDTSTDGGAFFANYFNYKLVDKNGYHVPINDNKCGIMLKNNLRQEVSSLSASFALPDMTPNYNTRQYPYCLEDENHNKYASNMINFEIKNDLANVTVIAAPSELGSPSVLGVYRMDANEFEGNIADYEMRFMQDYDDPDYAFFMPDDEHLTYFDYVVDEQTKKGTVGVYKNGNFNVADKTTDPTIVSAYGYSVNTEHGYASDKTRLFAHTFCLPRGRYCLGSASSCVPKVYYICAQGQDDGQFDFDDTVFASADRVEKIDFLKMPRFNQSGTENIIIEDVTTYDPSDNKLGNQRCYIALVDSDRSLFANTQSDLSFVYNTSNGKFVISSSLSGSALSEAILHLAVDNYKPQLVNGNNKQLTVVLFNRESSGDVFVYPFGS